MRNVAIKGLINTIITKELAPYFKIANIHLLQTILSYVYDNIGCEFSSVAIANYLKSNTSYKKVSPKIIDKYLSYLVDEYIVYKVERYDIRGKKD